MSETSVPSAPARSTAGVEGAVVTRWAWEWRGWTRLPLTIPILLVAAATVAVDVAAAWGDVRLGWLGRIGISPALPLAVILVAMIGVRRLGLDRANRRAWRELLTIGFLALGVAVNVQADTRGWSDALGFVVGALAEELVYRLALLVVVGAACARLIGRDWRNAREWGLGPGLVALVLGGFVFSVLPGHVAQMSDGIHAVPFACLGIVLGYAVLRTGALIPAAIVHALTNLATVAAVSGGSLAGRNVVTATALGALVAGTVIAGRRLGLLRRVPVEIDLTAPRPRVRPRLS